MDPLLNLHKFACQAMATRFEFLLAGDEERFLRAAAEQAFDEIERVERMLSAFLASSEVAGINRQIHGRPIRISPELMQILSRARYLSEKTAGAFDITVGPLAQCWRRAATLQAVPSPEDIASALDQTGMRFVELEEKRDLLTFHRPGMQLDFGAIGKGYALERAAEILLDAGVESGLLHGGTSSVYAIGKPPGREYWPVGIAEPTKEFLSELAVERARSSVMLGTAHLSNNSLSVSAVWGKGFKEGEHFYGHVLDPRTGLPVQKALSAAVIVDNPTDADALSTALLIIGEEELETLVQSFNTINYLVVLPDKTVDFRTIRKGASIEEIVR